MKDKKVYLVEWGFLLNKDSCEYKHYSSVYGGKNAYYDLNQYYSTRDLDKLIIELTECLKKECGNSYVVVSYQCMLSNFNVEEIGNDEELNNYYFDTSDLDYSWPSVVFSAYKDENNNIHIDFIGEEML